MKYNCYHKLYFKNQHFLVGEKSIVTWSETLDKMRSHFPLSDCLDEKIASSDVLRMFSDLYSCSEHVYYTLDGNELSRMTYSKSLFKTECESAMTFIIDWTKKFHSSNPDGEFYPDRIPYELPNHLKGKFYRAIKYYYASRLFNQWLLEENRFYSLPLLLESSSDINASFLLASNFYYKQAHQMLRNHLELMIAQYYFSLNTDLFVDWRKIPDVHMPQFRGKTGMLNYLLKVKAITIDDKTRLDTLFQNLSGYTHSKYNKLLHYDEEKNKTLPFKFNEKYFSIWLDNVILTLEFGVIILSNHIKNWESQLMKKDNLICPVCYNEDMSIRHEKYGSLKLFSYTCQRCGEEILTDKKI